MYAVTRELVEGYAEMFVQCWDYYAVQQADGSYRPCYQRLSLSRLADHLRGRYTLGTYVLNPLGYCSFAVFDADGADGLERLMQLRGELAASGISSVVEASRRGGHLWVVFVQPTRARLVRRWLLPYAQAYGVELYPKQDMLGRGGVGSLVRLPLGVHRQSGGWYPFLEEASQGVLVPVGESVATCVTWVLAQVERVVVPEMREETWEEAGETSGAGATSGVGRGSRGLIQQWCRTQEIGEVIGRYTRLDARGVGRCPLPGHHYRGDVRPSLQVFDGADAHWYCYTWGRAGDLFDFLRFLHGFSVQEAWERLQEGTLG